MNRMLNSNKNWEYSKILTKIEIFESFDQMRGLRFFLPKSRFTKILSEVKLFQNQDFPKILTKIAIFQKFY